MASLPPPAFVSGASAYFKTTLLAKPSGEVINCTGVYISGETREAVEAVMANLISQREQFSSEAFAPFWVASRTTIVLIPRKAEENIGFSKEFLARIEKIAKFESPIQ